MSPAYYDQVTLRKPEINTGVFTFGDVAKVDISAFKGKLMDNEGVLGTMIVPGCIEITMISLMI